MYVCRLVHCVRVRTHAPLQPHTIGATIVYRASLKRLGVPFLLEKARISSIRILVTTATYIILVTTASRLERSPILGA